MLNPSHLAGTYILSSPSIRIENICATWDYLEEEYINICKAKGDEKIMSYEEYVRENKIEDKSEDEKNLELIVSIIKTKNELDAASKNFEYAEEGLIDYYSYQIKANQTKLDYLMKKAQQKGIVLDMINEIYIRKNKA